MNEQRRTLLRASAAAAVSSLVLPGCSDGGLSESSWLKSAPIDPRSTGYTVDGRSFCLGWNEEFLAAVRRTGMGPPIVARSLVILHTALYDTWSRFDSLAKASLATTLGKRPSSERGVESSCKALAFAGWRAMRSLFPTESASTDSFLNALGYQTSEATSSPASIGVETADAVITARLNDGSNVANAYADTTSFATTQPALEVAVAGLPAGTDPTRWQPLIVPTAAGGTKTQKYMVPHWGQVRPFALQTGADLRTLADAVYKAPGTSASLAEIDEVLSFYSPLDDERKVIAEYWANGPGTETPPGHWCLHAASVSRRDNLSPEQDIKMFFVLANALLDASIAAWDYKRLRQAARPITQIRAHWANRSVGSWVPGVGNVTVSGAQWQPFQAFDFVTPPFPDHVSGHSTFSAAAAEALTLFTDSDRFGGSYIYRAGMSTVDKTMPSVPIELRWATFDDASRQAGESRLYGGIHVRSAHLGGEAIGKQVGRRVYERAKALFSGA